MTKHIPAEAQPKAMTLHDTGAVSMHTIQGTTLLVMPASYLSCKVMPMHC